jgi:hypothetical protein
MSLAKGNRKFRHDRDSAIETDDERRSISIQEQERNVESTQKHGQAQNSMQAHVNTPPEMNEPSNKPRKKTSSRRAQVLRSEDDSTEDYAFVTFGTQKYHIQGYDHQNRRWTGDNVAPEILENIQGCLLDSKIANVVAKIWSIEYLQYHRCTQEYAEIVLASMEDCSGYKWESEYWEVQEKMVTDTYTAKVFQVAHKINAFADAKEEFKITTKRPSEDHYRPRAIHYLPIGGNAIFKKFRDVIDTQKITSKDSIDEDAVEYGVDFLAHACYIAATESTDEDRWIKWRQCQEAAFGDHTIMRWPKEDMEIRDVPELAMAKRAHTLSQEVRVCTGQNRRRREVEHIKNQFAKDRPSLEST